VEVERSTAPETAVRWRLVQNLGVLIVGCAFAFGIGELLARTVLPPPPPTVVAETKPPPVVAAATSGGPTTALRAGAALYYNTPTGRRLRPNTRVVIAASPFGGQQVTLETNALGFRNRPIGDKAGTRVLFLGDSVTVQDYLPEEHTLVRLVESTARTAGRHWETINAGVGAIGLATELAILEESGLRVAPDIVVVDFYLNDHADSPGVYLPALPGPLARSWLARHVLAAVWTRRTAGSDTEFDFAAAPPRPQQRQAWLQDLRRAYPPGDGDYRTDPRAFNALIVRNFRDWGGAWSPGVWETLVPRFMELKRLGETHGFRPAVVVFPVRQQVEARFLYDQPQQQLRALGARLGIPVLDLLPILREQAANEGGPLFYDHCHPTAAGNRIIARAIVDFLDAGPPADATGVP
jgi:hypothetical protein